MDYENVTNKNVFEMFVKTKQKISQYNKISVSISGGSDSDILKSCTAPAKARTGNNNSGAPCRTGC